MKFTKAHQLDRLNVLNLFSIIIYTVSPKTTDLACYNFYTHQLISAKYLADNSNGIVAVIHSVNCLRLSAVTFLFVASSLHQKVCVFNVIEALSVKMHQIGVL